MNFLINCVIKKVQVSYAINFLQQVQLASSRLEESEKLVFLLLRKSPAQVEPHVSRRCDPQSFVPLGGEVCERELHNNAALHHRGENKIDTPHESGLQQEPREALSNYALVV